MKRFIILYSFMIIIFGCANLNIKDNEVLENVMSPGMSICAIDKCSYVCISAQNSNVREITFDGVTRKIKLVPREYRWHGRLGLVPPKRPLDFWIEHDSVTMALIEECQIHYKSIDDVLKSFNDPYRNIDHFEAYNNEGLLLYWKFTELPKKQNVFSLSIFQMLVNKKKPEVLPGSRNEDICVSYLGDDSCLRWLEHRMRMKPGCPRFFPEIQN